MFQSDRYYIPHMNNFSVRATIILLRADLIRIWINSQCSFPLVFIFYIKMINKINKGVRHDEEFSICHTYSPHIPHVIVRHSKHAGIDRLSNL